MSSQKETDIGCSLSKENEEQVKKLLQDAMVASNNNFSKILIEDIRGFNISELDKFKESTKNPKDSLLHLLFEDTQHELPKIPDFFKSINKDINTSMPDISSKYEERLLKIKIN